jgi:hypothetical protein
MAKGRWLLSILLMVTLVGGCSEGLAIQPTPAAVEATREALSLPTVQVEPASGEITETTVALEPEQGESEVLSRDLSSYTGPNAYGSEYPDFAVNYDPALWKLVLVDHSQGSDRLESTQVSSCALMLNMGPIGSPAIQQKQIGSHEWYIAETNDPRALLYWAQVSDTLSFFFGLEMPNAVPTELSQKCITLAEEVMSTAAFVGENE